MREHRVDCCPEAYQCAQPLHQSRHGKGKGQRFQAHLGDMTLTPRLREWHRSLSILILAIDNVANVGGHKIDDEHQAELYLRRYILLWRPIESVNCGFCRMGGEEANIIDGRIIVECTNVRSLMNLGDLEIHPEEI